MPNPRTRPRNALALLLEAGKLRSETEWWQIDAELGLNKATRDSWLSGKTTKPPVYGICLLSRHLKITPDEMVAAVLDHTLPAWVPRGFIEREARED